MFVFLLSIPWSFLISLSTLLMATENTLYWAGGKGVEEIPDLNYEALWR